MGRFLLVPTNKIIGFACWWVQSLQMEMRLIPLQLFVELQSMLEQITNWEIDTLSTEKEYQFETQLAREKGWCSKYTHEVVEEYKKFLYLCKVSDFACVPSQAIDEAWHHHILRTSNYSKMCKELFGKFLHHAPTASRQDQQLLEEQFERTLKAYEKVFGTVPPSQAWKEKGNGICCSEI